MTLQSLQVTWSWNMSRHSAHSMSWRGICGRRGGRANVDANFIYLFFFLNSGTSIWKMHAVRTKRAGLQTNNPLSKLVANTVERSHAKNPLHVLQPHMPTSRILLLYCTDKTAVHTVLQTHTDCLSRCIFINFSHHICLNSLNMHNLLNFGCGSTETLNTSLRRGCICQWEITLWRWTRREMQMLSKVQNCHVLMTWEHILNTAGKYLRCFGLSPVN